MTKMIYRVEHEEDALGPWSHTEWMGVDYHQLNASRMPCPYADGITDVPWHIATWLHGFDSLDKLMRWFSDSDRARLRPHGFCLAIYEAEPCACICGRVQLIFREDSARRLQRLPL